jgi:hypothetical protein
VLAASVFVSSCAARAAFVPPAGAGTPAPEAAHVWTSVTSRCATVSTYRAELGLTGRIGERRIRGLASARLSTAVTRDGSLGLQATISGQLVFLLAGNADAAVLLLRDPNRVVRARPDEILDALIGVRLGPDRLLPIFAGCAARDTTMVRAASHGDAIEIVTTDTRIFLSAGPSGWQPRAALFDSLAVDYWRHVEGLPRELGVRSLGPDGPRVELHLDVREALVNADVPEAAFRVNVPAGSAEMSLDELRAAGPLVEQTPAS